MRDVKLQGIREIGQTDTEGWYVIHGGAKDVFWAYPKQAWMEALAERTGLTLNAIEAVGTCRRLFEKGFFKSFYLDEGEDVLAACGMVSRCTLCL